MKKLFPINFLHTHTRLENECELTDEHLIVNRKDYELLVDFFNENKDVMGRLHEYINTEHNDTIRPSYL